MNVDSDSKPFKDGNDRENPDRHAQQRQRRAQEVRAQGLPGKAETFKRKAQSKKHGFWKGRRTRRKETVFQTFNEIRWLFSVLW